MNSITVTTPVKKYSVTEYARKINRSRQRVLQMIEAKDIKAEKVGNNWIVYA